MRQCEQEVVHGPPAGPVGRATRLKQYLLFASLFVLPLRFRVRAMYEMDSTLSHFTNRTLYRNMGFWRDGPGTLDEASQALAGLLGEAAGLGPGDQVLDAGFGWADQDIHWAARFAPARIVGVDLIPAHVALARRRVAALGLDDRIDLRTASATDLPFADGSFDRVVALESAFQFDTRERFFSEAHRVLRPGGTIALTEPIPLGQSSRLDEYLQTTVVSIPRQNLYPREVYAAKLAEAGFVGVGVASIREHVVEPFMRHLAGRLMDPDVVRRVNPLIRGMWQGLVAQAGGDRGRGHHEQDYVLAVATRPSGPAGI